MSCSHLLSTTLKVKFSVAVSTLTNGMCAAVLVCPTLVEKEKHLKPIFCLTLIHWSRLVKTQPACGEPHQGPPRPQSGSCRIGDIAPECTQSVLTKKQKWNIKIK